MERGEKADRIETVKGDTHDLLDEGKERLKAGAEKLNRDLDRAKRDVRDSAERTEDGI